MFFLIIIGLVLFVFIATCGTYNAVNSRKTYGLPWREAKKYSWPAQRVLQAYHSIPETNRPYQSVNYMLDALDTKHGGRDSVNLHFTHSDWDSSWRGWCRHNGGPCQMIEYGQLVTSMKKITNALKEQEQAIKTSGVADGLNAVEDLRARLKSERELIESTTKELTNGGI